MPRTHAIVSDSAHLCSRCDVASFARVSNLYRHMRTCKGKLSTGETSPTPSGSTTPRPPTPRPASPTSQAYLTEERTPSNHALLPGDTISPDPSWGPTPIKLWEPRRAAPSTALLIPIARRVHVPDARLYLSVISAAGGTTMVPSSPQSALSPWSQYCPGLSVRHPVYAVTPNTTAGTDPSLSRPNSYTPTPDQSAIPPEISWPISQRVYGYDAMFYKSIVSTDNSFHWQIGPNASQSGLLPYSALRPGVGASRHPTHVSAVGQGDQSDAFGWGYTTPSAVAGPSNLPAQFHKYYNQGPVQPGGRYVGGFTPQADPEAALEFGWVDDPISTLTFSGPTLPYAIPDTDETYFLPREAYFRDD